MIKIETQKFEKIWGYEIWLYSPVVGKESKLDNGELAKGGPLVKIIHADRPLSVQVHPDDVLAKKLENQPNGKSESWYVLDAKEGSTIVTGLKTYDQERIRAAMDNKTFEELLIQTETKSGDFFNIEAGLVHGIGAGVTVLEVQQPSETTYRYFDYNRLENGVPRELHVDKALKVQKDLSFGIKPDQENPLKYTNAVGSQTFVWDEGFTVEPNFLVVNIKTQEAFITEEEMKLPKGDWAIITM